MRKSNREKAKEEIRKLIEEYFELATNEELTEFVGFMNGCIGKKKLGETPSLKEKL